MQATIPVDELFVFVAVARAGSFTAAARALATQKSHASRVVSRLEKRLGVRLLQRSTRSLTLTEVGRELYERATSILAALDETQSMIQRSQQEPQGVLKLTCGVEFGLLVVNRWIREFLKRYPRVRVDARFSDRLVDLVHEGFDLAIRVGKLPSSGLSARALGKIRYALYASPKYLQQRAAPAHPRELGAHDLIVFTGGASSAWKLKNGREQFKVEQPARLAIESHISVRDAIVEGLGIGLVPRFQAEPYVRNKKVVEVLPGWTREPAPVYALFASARYLTPKVRAFVDLACEQPANL